MSEFWFNKLRDAIARARSAVDPEGIAGYLLGALERRGRVTGLLFCDQSGRSRDGSPIQTGIIQDRACVEKYELIIASDGVPRDGGYESTKALWKIG
ncbi:hypothetical protein D3M70_26505 [Pseudomonas sp. LS-2]|nr:hypothetical protein D3M70_26505 [Pseudomonas sp. LS-2]